MTLLKEIRINKQGYDSKGRYWGVHLRLYEVDGGSHYIRAFDRKHAKEVATFYIKNRTGQTPKFYR